MALPTGYSVAAARRDMRVPLATWLAAHTGSDHTVEVGEPRHVGGQTLTLRACSCGATYGLLA
jgi:hypothetical protein